MIAVYVILNLINGKFYIGSSVNLFKRLIDHKILLRCNKHKNIHLQRAWNKHGEENFVFKILEFCDLNNVLEREQCWISETDCCNDKIGYNLSRVVTASQLGLKRTDEQKLRISEAHKGIKLKDHVLKQLIERNLGATRSDEAKANMSKAQKNNLALFKPDKWPHGYRCKCESCKELHKIEKRKYVDYRRVKFTVMSRGLEI